MIYRKHDADHVVNVDNVWPLIPIDDPKYQEWVAAGNTPLNRDSSE